METLSTIRLNTLKVEFGERCDRPTDHELIEFAIMLELLPDDIHTLYQDTNDDCIYIKLHDDDKVKEVLAKHKKVTFLYNNGGSTEVMLSKAQGTSRYVRVFNVPPEIEEEDIREVFGQYGTVLSVEREKYTDTFGFSVYNGVRGVCIELKKLMPSVVNVKNFRAKIFHRGLNDKCVICNSTEHDEHNCNGPRIPNRRLRRLHSEFGLKMADNENLSPAKQVTKKRQPVTRSKTFSDKSPPLVLERIESVEKEEVSIVTQEPPVPVKKDPIKVKELMTKLKQLSVNRGGTGISSLGV
jgi:RNA recognition motif. (a.k.a. RRM, RBD, or RNP domain)